jgi:hypothetical protein
MTEDTWKVRACVQGSLSGHESPPRARRSDPDVAQAFSRTARPRSGRQATADTGSQDPGLSTTAAGPSADRYGLERRGYA